MYFQFWDWLYLLPVFLYGPFEICNTKIANPFDRKYITSRYFDIARKKSYMEAQSRQPFVSPQLHNLSHPLMCRVLVLGVPASWPPCFHPFCTTARWWAGQSETEQFPLRSPRVGEIHAILWDHLVETGLEQAFAQLSGNWTSSRPECSPLNHVFRAAMWGSMWM